MVNSPLDIVDGVSGAAFIPVAIQVFSDAAQLDNELVTEVLGFDLAALLMPEPNESRLIVAHDDAGIGTTNERTPIFGHDTLIQNKYYESI